MGEREAIREREAEPPPRDLYEDLFRIFNENNARLRDLLFTVIPKLPVRRDCVCATALTGAVLGGHEEEVEVPETEAQV